MNRHVLPKGKSVPYRVLAFTVLMLFSIQTKAPSQDNPVTKQVFANDRVFSWEKLDGAEVREVGVTIPFALLENPHQQPGSGPAGAIAVVPFAKQVQDTTCLNHFELNWEKHGHEPPVFMLPHFDFHFYGVYPEAIRGVSGPDPNPPEADLIPAGYNYPGGEFAVPQMGVHAVRPEDMEKPFRDVLIFSDFVTTSI